MIIEIDVPEDMAEILTGLSLEQVNFYALAGLKRGIKTNAPRPKTFGDLMEEGWTPPTVEGRPRADGRPWSQIEASYASDTEDSVGSGG